MRTRNLAALVGAALLVVPVAASAWMAVGVRVVPRVAVGVAAGAVAGAAVASSYHEPSTVVVNPPPAAPPPVSAPATVGTIVTTLPSGCVSSGGRYQCGPVWYQPYFGGNGVYYQVVAP